MTEEENLEIMEYTKKAHECLLEHIIKTITPERINHLKSLFKDGEETPPHVWEDLYKNYYSYEIRSNNFCTMGNNFITLIGDCAESKIVLKSLEQKGIKPDLMVNGKNYDAALYEKLQYEVIGLFDAAIQLKENLFTIQNILKEYDLKCENFEVVKYIEKIVKEDSQKNNKENEND